MSYTGRSLLAIDGGGMKGYRPAAMLQELERRTGQRCFDIFDYFAGTSVGGIIALILANGGTAADTLEFFNQDGPKIFGTEHLLDPGGIRIPRYDPAAIENVLMTRLGTATLNKLSKPVFVPAFELYSYAPYFFFSGMSEDHPAWMVARATSAAETYFPAFAMGDKLFWDGGTGCNNPALLASIWASKRWPGESLRILSLGCGGTNSVLSPIRLADAGALEVGIELINATLSANDELPDLVLRYQRPQGYFRISPGGGKNLTLDGAKPNNLATLVAASANDILQFSDVLDAFIAYTGP